jgi:hypothetical protein
MSRFTYFVVSTDVSSGEYFAYIGDPTPLNDGDVLSYVVARSRWENRPMSAVLTYYDVKTKNASYPATLSDEMIIVNAGAATDITLPSAVGCLGKLYIIKRIDATAFVVQVIPDGVETIDGEASQPLHRWDSMSIVSDGAVWFII